MAMSKLNVDVGAFIREQRRMAKISLRQLSALAGVSNPYLSQIERGMRKPSAEILQQIAKALRVSSEVMYVQAGLMDERHVDNGVVAAVLGDVTLSERQRQVLLEIYESFRRENDRAENESAQNESAQNEFAQTESAQTGTARTDTAPTDSAESDSAQTVAG
jgi:transcriptional regulator with XRE-family HTH domain